MDMIQFVGGLGASNDAGWRRGGARARLWPRSLVWGGGGIMMTVDG